MDLVKFATGRWGPSMAVAICRGLPRAAAYGLGDITARQLIVQERNPFVQVLRSNMQTVLELKEGDPEIDTAVFRLLKHTLYGYIDLFHALQNREDIIDMFEPNLEIILLLERCLEDGRGLLLVGTHTCSFDLLMLGFLDFAPSIQVLSNAEPQGSSLVMNELRSKQGLMITPISSRTLKDAVLRLQNGGVVAVANDIPTSHGEDLRFFGRECRMPVGHARLAALTNSVMMVSGSFQTGKGRYRVTAECIPAPKVESRKPDPIRWAQAALEKTEEYIREYPDQWLMPHPIWNGS